MLTNAGLVSIGQVKDAFCSKYSLYLRNVNVGNSHFRQVYN